MRKGCLFVISGPSGVGKSTIQKRVLAELDEISFSVSCTTRVPREGEVDGREYFFITEERFEEMEQTGEFLEFAMVHGHRYGTPLHYVLSEVGAGRDVILDVDVQGGLQVAAKYPETVTVFVVSPNFSETRRRLMERSTETPEQIALRLTNALGEVKMAHEYGYLLVNDNLEDAVLRMKHIICGERQKTVNNRPLLEELIHQIQEDFA